MRSKAQEERLRKVWEKTNGHCHFCGDPLEFENYGREGGDKSWVLDHVNQKGKGGSKKDENCLPACHTCNWFRWHRTGEDIRNLMWLGLIAKDEIKKTRSPIGQKLVQLSEKRRVDNEKRRTKKELSIASVGDETDTMAA